MKLFVALTVLAVACADPPTVSVDTDIVPWVASNHTATTVAEYHADIQSLGLSHPKVSALSDAAQHSKSGQFMPPLNTAYDPAASKSCCSDACAAAAGGQDCQRGCDMWLHTSSLNWESTNWWDVLKKKCQRDCMQSVLWKSVDAVSSNPVQWKKNTDRDSPDGRYALNSEADPLVHRDTRNTGPTHTLTDSRAGMGTSYWTADSNARQAPSDIAICQDGCKKYRACMGPHVTSSAPVYETCTCSNGAASTKNCLQGATEHCVHCERGYFLQEIAAGGPSGARARCAAATCDNGVVTDAAVVQANATAAAEAVAAVAEAFNCTHGDTACETAEHEALRAAADQYAPTHDAAFPHCTCNAGYSGGGRWIGGSAYPACTVTHPCSETASGAGCATCEAIASRTADGHCATCHAGYVVEGTTCVLHQSPEAVFINEYIEGSCNTKAIELHNPTAVPILMDGSHLQWHKAEEYHGHQSDHPDDPEVDARYYDIDLASYTIPAGGTLVFCREHRQTSSPTCTSSANADNFPLGTNAQRLKSGGGPCDLVVGDSDECAADPACTKADAREAVAHTGDDAIELRLDTRPACYADSVYDSEFKDLMESHPHYATCGAAIDVVGYPGEDVDHLSLAEKQARGIVDGDGDLIFRDHTLERKSTVVTGKAEFDASQWVITKHSSGGSGQASIAGLGNADPAN